MRHSSFLTDYTCAIEEMQICFNPYANEQKPFISCHTLHRYVANLVIYAKIMGKLKIRVKF